MVPHVVDPELVLEGAVAVGHAVLRDVDRHVVVLVTQPVQRRPQTFGVGPQPRRPCPVPKNGTKDAVML